MSEREQCRDLREWQTIGTVSTSNGMLAIVPPYFAHTLGHWWDDQLEKLDRIRQGLEPRIHLEFEEIKLDQITSSVTNPDGYRDTEFAFAFSTGHSTIRDVEARFCHQHGEGPELCELRIRLHHYDDEPGEEPNLTPLASRFATLLRMSLTEWVDLGRLKGRRLDDLLFHEWNAERDGDFSGFVIGEMYADWQRGGPLEGEPFPPHRSIQWQVMIITAAINTRDPELVAAMLEAEVQYEGKHPSEWVDEDGNIAVHPEHEASMLDWPSEWRRVFGTP